MKLDRRRLLTGGLLLALGGCTTSGGGVRLVMGPSQDSGELETLRGVVAGREGLTLRVASTGCTTKADFVFYVGREGDGQTVAFARKRLDLCRAAASVVEVAFSYEELGLARTGTVRLLNPVAS